MADKESNDILMSLQQLETRLQSELGTAESPGTIATSINEIKRILRGERNSRSPDSTRSDGAVAA